MFKAKNVELPAIALLSDCRPWSCGCSTERQDGL
jgi:hypothetical protein